MTNNLKAAATLAKVEQIKKEHGMSIMKVYEKLGKTMTRIEINEKLGLHRSAYTKHAKLCKKHVNQWAELIFIKGMSNQESSKLLGYSVSSLNRMLRCGYKVVKCGDKYELKKPKFLELEEYLTILSNRYGGIDKLTEQLEKWVQNDGYYMSKVTIKLKLPSVHITKAIFMALDVDTKKMFYEKPVDKELLRISALCATWFNSFTCAKRGIRRLV